MTVAVTQRAFDAARTFCNPAETVLTAAAVRERGLKLAFSHVLPGDLRGTEGQVLIAPAVKLPDGRTLDVAVYGTQGNSVLGFDAASEELLWTYDAGGPVNNSTELDGYLINDHWGVMGTGVLDLAAGVGYWCAWSSVDGTAANAQHVLHAVNLADGTAHHAPVSFEGITYTSASGNRVTFKGAMRKQRTALLLLNGIVFTAMGSVSETSHTARGWLVGWDTKQQQFTAAWASTSSAKGWGGGIWQAGGGPASDGTYLYVMTGNGTFAPPDDWSESFVKLQYTPPPAGKMSVLTVVGNWTPYTDDAWEGLDPGGEDYGELYTGATPVNVRTYTQAEGKGLNDLDLGSGSPTLNVKTGILYGAGKLPVTYPVNTAGNMGGTRPADLEKPAGNYARLGAPATITAFDGVGIDPMPDDITTIPYMAGGYTHHQHGEQCLIHLAETTYLVNGAENGNVNLWTVQPDHSLSFVAKSAEWASWGCGGPPGGMPGTAISAAVSPDNPNEALIVAVMPELDANQVISPGRLLIYSTSNLGAFADGTKQLVPLWDSWQWGWQSQGLTHNKFNRAVAANGFIYLPTFSGEVWVLSLT